MANGYNPNKYLIKKSTQNIGKIIDFYTVNYDNFLIVGDLNSESTESSMHEFCNIYDLHSLCHKSTCCKKSGKNHHALIFF